MNTADVMNYINGVLALVAGILYTYNASRCKTAHWKTYKYMLASCMYIIFVIYAMFIFKMNVDPLVVRLNTTFFITLMILNALLGRSKYGRRC